MKAGCLMLLMFVICEHGQLSGVQTTRSYIGDTGHWISIVVQRLLVALQLYHVLKINLFAVCFTHLSQPLFIYRDVRGLWHLELGHRLAARPALAHGER